MNNNDPPLRSSTLFSYFGGFFPKSIVELIHNSYDNLDLPGFRSEPVLDFIIKKINDNYLDENVFRVASVIFYEIIQRHPYWDGNKRTGFSCGALILISGKKWYVGEDLETEQFCIRSAKRVEEAVRNGTLDELEPILLIDIERWFREKSVNLPWTSLLEILFRMFLTQALIVILNILSRFSSRDDEES